MQSATAAAVVSETPAVTPPASNQQVQTPPIAPPSAPPQIDETTAAVNDTAMSAVALGEVGLNATRQLGQSTAKLGEKVALMNAKLDDMENFPITRNGDSEFSRLSRA